jgi:hypothetical protein
MKTARMMFPLMLAMTAGCATTLDQSSALRPATDVGGDTAAVVEGASCVVSGTVRTIAPTALVRPGIELVSTADGLAIGFSRTPHDAVALKIDASSAMTTGTFSRHSSDRIRRVTPLDRGANAIDAAIDADCKSNPLQGAVTISAKEPFSIGTTHDDIAWASCASETPRTLWHFSQGAVEDLRGIALSDGGYAVVFRQGGSAWFGRLDSEKVPVAPLKRIAERASLRGPMLAESGDNVMVVWTERSATQDNWSLGGASIAPCGHATPVRLDTPMAGAEGDAIQPALAPVDGGHFLLVWTEGPAWTHQVRAVTIESHGRAVGPVLQVSSGAESGWGRPAITADGRGAVVYLVPTGSGFAVAATPIACPTSSARTTPISTRL